MTVSASSDFHDLHLTMQLLQTLDNGLVLLDKDYEIHMWNSFMEHHSGISSSDARGKKLFELFPDLPAVWLKRKIQSVFQLGSRSFCTWEEHAHLFNFSSTRPLTGNSARMYQNICLTPLYDTTNQVSGVCLSVYDVTEVATRKIDLEKANERLERLSRTDPLTGLSNRGYWEDSLKLEFERCRRANRASTLLLLDIDKFKTFNDEYGHQAGDEVMRAIGDLVHRFRRSTDVVGRYGGEEFGVILPETTAENAMIFAERLRKRIEGTHIVWQSTPLHVTVSIGMSQITPDMNDYHAWLSATDQALYQAKDQGRNRVVNASPLKA